MATLRRTVLAALTTAALAGVTAAPASAIVGGTDAAPGQFPAVASVTLGGLFSCTGTLIAPTWLLTAGHCGSITGGAGVSSPIAWPAPLIDVRLNSTTAHTGGGDALAVRRAVIPPQYLGLQNAYDVTLLELTTPSAVAPVPVAGPQQTSLWSAGVLQTIVGFGVTSEGGSAPDVLQVAQVPAIGDAQCAAKESAFDPLTMVCAGFPQGGVDTCQGDSGGPMFGKVGGSGALRVTGATSFGTGCARPDTPGVYARVGDAELRSFIATYAPQAIDGGPASVATAAKSTAKKKKVVRKKKRAATRRRA
jgi:trypsin